MILFRLLLVMPKYGGKQNFRFGSIRSGSKAMRVEEERRKMKVCDYNGQYIRLNQKSNQFIMVIKHRPHKSQFNYDFSELSLFVWCIEAEKDHHHCLFFFIVVFDPVAEMSLYLKFSFHWDLSLIDFLSM